MSPFNRSKVVSVCGADSVPGRSGGISKARHRAAARILFCALPFALAPAAHAAGYNVTTVTDPTGTNFINLLGINDSGTIAGFDNAVTAQGFTLTLPSNFTNVILPPAFHATSSMATGINAQGDISGIYTDTAGRTHGFTEIGGTFKTVDDPASTVFNQALGINNADVTVGYYAPTRVGAHGQIAYSQSGGNFFDINSLLPSNKDSQAVGINNKDDIVGFYMPTGKTSVGFLDFGGVISTIDPFGSTFTQALGINDMGDIVGFYVDSTGDQHGYIDDDGVFTSFDPTGSASTTINGINDLDQIVGFYTNNNDAVVGFVGTPVPEPLTWVMMLLGFAGLGFAGYRGTGTKVTARSI